MLSLCLSIEELNKSLNGCQRVVVLVTVQGIKRENTHLLEYPAAKVVSVGIGDTTEPIREVITSNMAEQMWKKTLDGCQSPEDMPKIVKEVCLSYDYKPTVKGMLMIAAEIGCLWGKGGMIIAEMRRVTGASIYIFPREHVAKYGMPSHEVVQFSAEVGVEPGAPIIGRLLVHLRQIGCLWGKGGMIIAEMRRVTGASIYIFPREHVAKYGMPSHEVVQPEIFVQPCAGEPSALRELRLERKKAGDKALRKYTHKQFLQPSSLRYLCKHYQDALANAVEQENPSALRELDWNVKRPEENTAWRKDILISNFLQPSPNTPNK
ncbi:KH domain-containing protein HEN4 isoform X1 [Tanacetum coccineum]